jgi:hypothetical protein
MPLDSSERLRRIVRDHSGLTMLGLVILAILATLALLYIGQGPLLLYEHF